MSYVLSWSPLSEGDIEENLVYLEKKWGPRTAKAFLDRLEKALQKVQENPKTYLEIDKARHIHKFVLNKHITLYYQLQGGVIYLITFWHNSKDQWRLDRLLKQV